MVTLKKLRNLRVNEGFSIAINKEIKTNKFGMKPTRNYILKRSNSLILNWTRYQVTEEKIKLKSNTR